MPGIGLIRSGRRGGSQLIREGNAVSNTELIQGQAIVPTRSGPSIFSSSPAETVRFATELANVLKPIIDGQGMFSSISGKKHVKAEGWLTLGAMLGILPRETGVSELPDGSFEAHVNLVNTSGVIVGGASAICGIEEARWARAERYARRSMAVTRATVKAYRIAFSWIIQLSGYSPTPAEEMPSDEPQPHKGDTVPKYRHNDKDCQDWLKSRLEKTDVPAASWKDFSMRFHGQYMTDLAIEVAVAKLDHAD